jgi:putative ABC transport system substrate-binding protein
VKRRDFITLLGGAAAWPLAARAQQPGMPVIGFLHSGSLDGWASMVAAFREGLSDAGYPEGQNVAIEFRWADGNYDRLPVLAADLVSRQVNVIVTPGSTPATLAAKAATTTIPIVFAVGGDPVKFGFVTSFNRPGGNLTGVSLFAVTLEAKRVELLCELVPNATVLALLINPNTPVYDSETTEVQSAGRLLGRQILVLNAGNERDIDVAFSRMVELRVGALLVSPDTFYQSRRDQIVALATRKAIPTMYSRRDFADAGGPTSCEASIGCPRSNRVG